MDFEIEQSFGSNIQDSEDYPFLRQVHSNAQTIRTAVKRSDSIQQSWQEVLRVTDPPGFSLEDRLYRSYLSCCLTTDQLKQEGYPGYSEESGNEELQPDMQAPNYAGKPSFERRVVAVDCEMVQTTEGTELARITLVDYHCNPIYDEYVKPAGQVRDYRTSTSGVTEQLLSEASKSLHDVHSDLSVLLHPSTVLVGHSLNNDLRALRMRHGKVIDTAVLYERNGRKVKLKQLAYELLDKVLRLRRRRSFRRAPTTPWRTASIRWPSLNFTSRSSAASKDSSRAQCSPTRPN